MNIPEVEAKILEINQDEVEKKLMEIWAVYQSTKEFIAIWLEWNNQNKVRIRKEWSETKIEHKEKQESVDWVQVCNEVWFESSCFENSLELFKRLWFKQLSRSVKERISYLLTLENWSSAEVVFDTYSDLEWIAIPTYIEIECKTLPDLIDIESTSTNQVINEAYKVVVNVANLLWFTEKDFKDWWRRELVNYYRIIEVSNKDITPEEYENIKKRIAKSSSENWEWFISTDFLNYQYTI